MRLARTMEQNKDTAGWGLVGALYAYATSADLWGQLVTAFLVAAAGMLGSILVKKLYNYGEGQISAWIENRKTKKNNELQRRKDEEL